MEASETPENDAEYERSPPLPPFHNAACRGDISEMERLLAEGAEINGRTDDEERLTPLMVAAYSVDGATADTLAWLYDHGADLHAVSDWEGSAAWYAAGKGERWVSDDWPRHPRHVERLRFLLDAGLDAHETISNGRSLLVESCRAGDPARVRLLLERGVSPQNNTGETREYSFQIPLFCATESGSGECVQLLLDAGADVFETTLSRHGEPSGESALMYATSAEVARALIAAGALVNAHDGYDDVLAHVLESASNEAEHGEPNTFAAAEVLLEAGASLDGPGTNGWTRLYHEAFRYHAAAVEWLLAHGASHALTPAEHTPLHAVCWKGAHSVMSPGDSDSVCERIIQALVAAGIPLEARDDEGRTPLHKAVGGDWGNAAAARTLLRLGADPNAVDGYGESPLHIAARKGELACMEELLAGGANPLQKDSDDYLPLDHAARHKEIWQQICTEDKPLPGLTEDTATRQARQKEALHKAEQAHALLLAITLKV